MKLTRHLHIVISEDMDNWINLRAHFNGTSKGEVVRQAITKERIASRISTKTEVAS